MSVHNIATALNFFNVRRYWKSWNLGLIPKNPEDSNLPYNYIREQIAITSVSIYGAIQNLQENINSRIPKGIDTIQN